jgi:HlyD family secretion protein
MKNFIKQLNIKNGWIAIGILMGACTGESGKYDASGVFEATEIIVSAKETGEILELNLREGDTVTAGSALGVIDTTQLFLKKKQLEASKGAIRARMSNVPKQIASLQQQITTQKQEQKRFENLVSRNAANQKQLDDINAQVVTLEKQLSAQLETLDNGNRGMLYEIASLDAQIEQLNDHIRNSVIRSPTKGTILAMYAERGELAMQGKSLFKFADVSRIFLRAYITADQLNQLKIGQRVTVYSDKGKSDRQAYEGVITWIADKAEFTPKTIQTRNERANLVYAVKIAVHNDGLIKIGMYGQLTIDNQN